MALHHHNQSNSNHNRFLSIKVLLISTSVLSMALMLKLSMPVITEFTLSELPSAWSVVNSWLRPPYLYVIINCIIITIVASSRLQYSKVDDLQPQFLPPETATVAALLHTEPVKLVIPRAPDYDPGVVSKHEALQPLTLEFDQNGCDANLAEVPELYGTIDAGVPETETMTMTMIALNAPVEIKSVNEFMTSKSVMRSASNKDITDFSSSRDQRPPVSARFGHRKSIKANPEGGRTLGVTKPKRQDTLESTWKTITEGRPMPLTRHLRKSDTWETHGHHHQEQQQQDDDQRMTKSETFNVGQPPATLSRSTGSGKLKKEPSLGQDELNRRVEAFIRKFNEDMRLQRQESLNQYMEMINRGAHELEK